MGLRFFVYGFFVAVTLLSFLTLESKTENREKAEVPTIIFSKASLYSLDDKNLKAIFVADRVLKYSDRDEFYDAVYTTQNKAKNIVDSISAKKSIYKQEILYCEKDVKINRNSNIFMNSQNVIYDTKTKVFESKTPFDATYNGHSLKGDNMVAYDNLKIFVDNPHFEIEVKK